uniref:Uncharacterized protein n=1 Tax=Rhizophora mucronata TaxID=61149 RepID=A0A2P2MW47_RHIMU
MILEDLSLSKVWRRFLV